MFSCVPLPRTGYNFSSPESFSSQHHFRLHFNRIGRHHVTDNLSPPILFPALFRGTAIGFLLGILDPRKLGAIFCAETTVMNYQNSLRNDPEECSSLLTKSVRLSPSAPLYPIPLWVVLIPSSYLFYLDAKDLSCSSLTI
jgi:hypothetical protein